MQKSETLYCNGDSQNSPHPKIMLVYDIGTNTAVCGYCGKIYRKNIENELRDQKNCYTIKESD